MKFIFAENPIYRMSSEWPEIFHSKHGTTCDEDFIFTNKQMDS